MKFFHKQICVLAAILALVITNMNIANSAPAVAPVKTKPVSTAVTEPIALTNPIDVVNNPRLFLGKTITFEADYLSFSSLGLDYKPAFKDSAKYIGVLIKRNDVKDHDIPLSEMKIFIPREIAEKNVDIEKGDRIRITGTVFSMALGDPWVDAK
ncbi:hypothetical protein II906_12410, partial [bacterium]|nr:hypothetical protein [bacterium]